MFTDKINANMAENIYTQTQNKQMSVNEIFTVLFKRKFVLLAFTLAGFLLAVFATFIKVPIYTADALLQVEKSNAALPGLDELSRYLKEEVSSTTEIELLRSRKMIGQAIETLKISERIDLQIHAQPKHFPVVGKAFYRRAGGGNAALVETPEFLGFDLSQYAWGGERVDVKDFSVESQESISNWKLVKINKDQYNLFDKNDALVLRGRIGRKAEKTHERYGIVSITVKSFVGQPNVIFMLSRFTHSTIVSNISGILKVNEIRGSLGSDTGLIKLYLSFPDPTLAQKLLKAIVDTYVKESTKGKSAETEEALEFVKSQLPALEQKVEKAETQLNKFRDANGTTGIGNIEVQKTIDKIANLERQISSTELKKTELLQQFTESHPQVVTINGKLKQLRTEKRKFSHRLKELPRTEHEFAKLSGELDAAKKLYDEMANKERELEIANSVERDKIAIVDQAKVGEQPTSPFQKKFMLMVGIFLGFGFGSFYLLYRHMSMKSKLYDSNTIEQKTGLPVFASIPLSKTQKSIIPLVKLKNKERKLLAESNPDDYAVEAIRSFRATLQFLNKDSNDNIISITSPNPNAGKSFLTANIAALFSDINKKVLLIDADMRKGHLHEYFKIKRTPGLSDFIRGDEELVDVIYNYNDYLSILPTGNITTYPSELLTNDKLPELLSICSKEYDLVIIDNTPVLAVADASIVSRYADLVFIVAELSKYGDNVLIDSIRRLEQNGVDVKGIVINKINLSDSLAVDYQYHYS